MRAIAIIQAGAAEWDRFFTVLEITIREAVKIEKHSGILCNWKEHIETTFEEVSGKYTQSVQEVEADSGNALYRASVKNIIIFGK